jgi:hypothetical protein
MKTTMSTVSKSRHLCSEQVSVVCSDVGGWWHTVPGNLEEIGEWSATILSEASISIGKHVRILCASNQLRGVVTTCKEDELGFFIEVTLDPDSRWSERWFTPQHFLKLSSKLPLRAAS